MKVRKFERSLPRHVHEILIAIGSLAEEMGYSAYLAGGVVRDILLGMKNLDIDISIEGDAIKLGRELAARTGSILKGVTRFGTCKVQSKAFGTIDLSTARKETYGKPGALPDVSPAKICEDLGRRDFTVNAMAISLAPDSYGYLIDPFGGLKDLRMGILRVLHEKSFIDDPTRILRGVRIAARYSLRFERKTRRYLRGAIRMGCLSTVSGPRIFDELRLICSEDDPRPALLLLRLLGIMESIFGSRAQIESRDLIKLKRSLEAIGRWTEPGKISNWVVYFAYLFKKLSKAEIQEKIAYLNLPGEARKVCQAIYRLDQISRDLIKKKDPYLVTTRLEEMPIELIVHIYASSKVNRPLIRKFLMRWRHIKPILSGSEIADLGVTEGCQVGKMIKEIRRLKLRGQISTRQDEVDLVKSRLVGGNSRRR